MRRLASLSRDSRSRRASFSWASSLAFFIPCTSVQVRTACDLPAHRASGMSVSALRKLHRGKLAENWSEIEVLNGRCSTDFTQHSMSHCSGNLPQPPAGKDSIGVRLADRRSGDSGSAGGLRHRPPIEAAFRCVSRRTPLTRVCKNEIIATNRPRRPWIPE